MIDYIFVFEWVIPLLFLLLRKKRQKWLKQLNATFAFNKNNVKRWNTWLWSGFALFRSTLWHKTFSFRQSFLCSAVQYASLLHFCLWRQKCNCKQQHDRVSQPGFSHWNWGIKLNRLLTCRVACCSLYYDIFHRTYHTPTVGGHQETRLSVDFLLLELCLGWR